MRKPTINMQIFKDRRAQLASLTQNSAIILAAHPEQIRNHDVHQGYRQDSNLFFLTGFEEPESVLVFRPGKKPETVMFVRQRDPERETWDGFRYGPEGVVKNFGVDAAFPIEELESKARELLMDVDKVYYTLFKDPEFDEKVARILLAVKAHRRRSGRGILPIYDTYPLLGEMRVRKSAYEIETMRKACQISAEAHIALMRATKPGVSERYLQGLFIKEIMERGAAREGYGSIVAGGNAATTLHYVFNDQKLNDGDLLLVDAGAEFDYYTGDITRTYPVNGKFSPVQKRIYTRLLELQKSMVKAVRPGTPFTQLQDLAVDGLIDIMMAERLLTGTKSEIKESTSYRKYYPHGAGHFLGSDVHDTGIIEIAGKARALEPGMIVTIEPGIYIPADDQAAPAELRGLGIRIEDDVLVGEDGPDNLTIGAPKEVAELEDLIGKQ